MYQTVPQVIIYITYISFPDVPNVIIIITDGESNINHMDTLPEARLLKSAGVTMITVAVGFAEQTTELIGLTSPPLTSNLIRVENYDALHNLKNKLLNPLCTGNVSLLI